MTALAAGTKVVVLSGAGMSAESGIRTFRDNGGLWENHDVMEVASPQAWTRNPELVNRFYNARRAQLDEVEPNEGHRALARLEKHFQVDIITQNVDDLHERAGSSNVLHLHGELRKVRSSVNPDHVLEWQGELSAKDCCPQGRPLRPHIVWFGEEVPAIGDAVPIVAAADVVLVVGTSLQVYPAAGLVDIAPDDAYVYYIDPNPAANSMRTRKRLRIIAGTAATTLPQLVNDWIGQAQTPSR